MKAAQLPEKTLYIGASWDLGYLLRLGGVALDLTPAGVDVTLKFTFSDGTSLSLSKGGGDTSWVSDGTDGQIRFHAEEAATAVAVAGWADVEILYTDSSASPTVTNLHAQGKYRIEASRTGIL